MIRFVFILLLVAAGALIVALFFDRRGHKDARLLQLRSAFLHRSALGGYARQSGLQEVACGELRMRIPASWTCEDTSASGATFRDTSSRVHTLRIDVLSLDCAGEASVEGVEQMLGARKPEKERSLERLEDGRVLLRCLELQGTTEQELVGYCWQLARPVPPQQARLAAITFKVPAARATDVVVEADIALLEREIRVATLA